MVNLSSGIPLFQEFLSSGISRLRIPSVRGSGPSKGGALAWPVCGLASRILAANVGGLTRDGEISVPPKT